MLGLYIQYEFCNSFTTNFSIDQFKNPVNHTCLSYNKKTTNITNKGKYTFTTRNAGICCKTIFPCSISSIDHIKIKYQESILQIANYPNFYFQLIMSLTFVYFKKTNQLKNPFKDCGLSFPSENKLFLDSKWKCSFC